jgi:Holliday junction resolvasome RuvABC endonuclease subunit
MKMKTLGLRCTKDTLDWAVLEGSGRSDATILEQRRVPAPPGGRGEQLAWVRLEILALVDRHTPSQAAVRVVEGSGMGSSFGRAEAEGVVQECLAAKGVPCKRMVSASLRSAFGAKNKDQLAEIQDAVPCIATTAKTRREPVAAAVALLPK